MQSTFLTPQEVCELTGRKKKSAQAIELKRMKIQHWINAPAPQGVRVRVSFPAP